jgi:hypothetical protein
VVQPPTVAVRGVTRPERWDLRSRARVSPPARGTGLTLTCTCYRMTLPRDAAIRGVPHHRGPQGSAPRPSCCAGGARVPAATTRHARPTAAATVPAALRPGACVSVDLGLRLQGKGVNSRCFFLRSLFAGTDAAIRRCASVPAAPGCTAVPATGADADAPAHSTPSSKHAAAACGEEAHAGRSGGQSHPACCTCCTCIRTASSKRPVHGRGVREERQPEEA